MGSRVLVIARECENRAVDAIGLIVHESWRADLPGASAALGPRGTAIARG